MRRADKKQAEETVDLLKRSHLAIKKALDAKNSGAALELLEQCQGCAISLGEKIEAVEGQGTPTVSLLERYCELLYQTYEKVRMLGKANGGQVQSALTKQLKSIGDSIRKDIPVRTEAVFLPYKASMWDSLESVWRAADEDPDCDAFVIPIPYYEKNPDGSFGQMHYEGNLYPKDVPITHYEDYDFANRQPDMIFIHNPYDQYNYLTSIHPFFYTKNLKKFTEKLIYIPYFVLGEPDRDDENAIEHISGFCTLPGVIYADKVIVQSENMRQIYIDILTKFMDGHGVTRKDWEKKILGLGSPKTDKVLRTKKEDTEIPEEWRPIIEKPDGSWKKVVLYNTGLTAFLQHSSQYVDKMRSVFQIFQEAKEDVALLWRPHPLLENTIKTMRPQLWEDYEEILEKYRREGWGIYDDSSDLNRAIAVCDAYYGDGSSVVQLCQEVGKVIMIQNVDILE